jgi:hypothetical protein
VRNWQQFVRERLGALGLSQERDTEIAEELAGYLEDRFDSTQCADSSPEISDWQKLRRDLRRASLEDGMNERTRTLWVPGLLTLAVASALWRALLLAGLEPKVIWMTPKSTDMLYLFVPWLIGLPLIGAGGAYWARRMGAEPKKRAVVSMFPALGMLGFMALGIAVQLILQPRMFVEVPVALVLYLASFVFIPAACLLLGALPFLRNGGPAAGKAA